MLERYYKIARNNVRTANPFIELDREQFLEELEDYENVEKAFTECEYWIDENTPGYITGGVEIGDYTYHYIRTNDDEEHFITMTDIGRRN